MMKTACEYHDMLTILDTTKSISVIFWLAIAAVAVPVWAIAQQYHRIDIVMGGEDDCALTHGVYALNEVIGFDDGEGHHVICRYR